VRNVQTEKTVMIKFSILTIASISLLLFWISSDAQHNPATVDCDDPQANYPLKPYQHPGHSNVHQPVILGVVTHIDDEFWGFQNAMSYYCANGNARGVVVTSGHIPSHAGKWDFYIDRRAGSRTNAWMNNSEARMMGGLVDSISSSTAQATRRLTRIIRELQPDIVMGHSPHGEYGHSDHVATSSITANAVNYAADPTKYPDQLTAGLSTWTVPKYYRWEYPTHTGIDTVTTTLDCDVYSPRLKQTFYEYAHNSINMALPFTRNYYYKEYFAAASGGSDPILHKAKYSLIVNNTAVPTPTGDTETDLMNGITSTHIRARSQPLRDWLVVGSYTSGSGNIVTDYLTEDGGETGISPTEGMVTDGKTWQSIQSETDFINLRKKFSTENMDTVAYAYTTIDSLVAQNAKIRISAHGEGLKIWHNGTLVLNDNVDRGDYSEEIFVPISLTAGTNKLLIKVATAVSRLDTSNNITSANGWGFYLKYDRESVSAAGEIDVTPAGTADYGSHVFTDGASAATTFTITNTDATNYLDITGVSILGNDKFQFVMTSDSGEPLLAPLASRTVQITYNPKDTGVHTAQLTVTSNDSDEGLVQIPLTGTGTLPIAGEYQGSSASLQYGSVAIPAGGGSRLTLTAQNAGSGKLLITNTAISGADASQFELVTRIGYPEVLTGAETFDVHVRFRPNSVGTKNASLVLTTNDSNEPTVTIPLQGTAVTRSNLAQGKPVTVSDFEGNDFGSKAVDGNINSVWKVDPFPATLQLDLEAEKNIDLIIMNTLARGTEAEQYTIEGSTDGTNWTMLVDKSDNLAMNINEDPFQHCFPAATVRYLKVTMTESQSGSFVGISEFRVYGVLEGVLASSPSPHDGATNVPLTAQLQWGSGLTGNLHDVYFGTDLNAVTNATTNSPEYQGRQSSTTFDPGALIDDEVYYWRIDEVEQDLDIVTGEVWQFSTGSNIAVIGLNLDGFDPVRPGVNTVRANGNGAFFDMTASGADYWRSGVANRITSYDIAVADLTMLGITDPTNQYLENKHQGGSVNVTHTVSGLAQGQYDVYMAFIASTVIHSDVGIGGSLNGGAQVSVSGLEDTGFDDDGYIDGTDFTDTTGRRISFVKIGTTAASSTGFSAEIDEQGRTVYLGLGYVKLPPNFNDWIVNYPNVGGNNGFDDDADNDGIPNGVESWLGTNPSNQNASITNVNTIGSTTTFSHPQNASAPTDVTGVYQWSPNLADWYTSGNGPEVGNTVTFTSNTVGNTTNVTAVSSIASTKHFYRIKVTSN